MGKNFPSDSSHVPPTIHVSDPVLLLWRPWNPNREVHSTLIPQETRWSFSPWLHHEACIQLPQSNSFCSMLDSNHSFENQGRIVCYHECTVPSTPLRAELTHANSDYYPSRENQGRTKLFTGLFRSVSQMHHNEHIQLPQGVEQAQPVVFVLHAHTNKDKKVDDMWNCSSWSSLFYMYRCWSYN